MSNKLNLSRSQRPGHIKTGEAKPSGVARGTREKLGSWRSQASVRAPDLHGRHHLRVEKKRFHCSFALDHDGSTAFEAETVAEQRARRG